MKRAVPQDVNSVLASAIDPDSAEEHPRQPLPEARTVRTSAAMLGLAISVGAYGIAAPQQGDAAVAAEPTPSDLSAGAATEAVAPIVTEPTAMVSGATTTYTVQEGQTLWKIAELYGIDAVKLANLNSLQTNAVLQVGQVLQVPAGNQTATVINGTPIKSLPDLKAVPTIPAQPIAALPTTPVAQRPSANKQKQTAIQDLKQNRDRLKQSLAELKSEESQGNSQQVVAAVPRVDSTNLVPYRVNPGETLSSIAQAHGLTLNELAKLNRIDNPNLVRANQFIQVPQIAQSPLPTTVATARQSVPADVQVPTVPSLASTQNATNPSVPIAVGGDASQIAFSGQSANRTRSNPRSVEAQPRSTDQYVNTLMSDIDRLRERYQARSNTAPAPSPAASASRRTNPEFRPTSPAAALRTESRSVNTTPQTRLEQTLANAPKRREQVVATATLGSESYSPILRSPVGKTVSPSLPPLGRSDAYMPGDRFKGYMWPAKGVLTSPYGWRWGRMHKGIDIAAPVGTPIMAAASGKVITAGWNDGGYGNLVEVQHPDGSVTLYGHNSRVLVRVGQQVRQGQQIAEMGSTGFSTGPHSHFEVHLPGRGAVNPIAYLPQNRS